MADEEPDKVAGYSDPVGKPRDWDKAVSASYLRMIGYSQVDAAAGAGVGERTLIRWEQCSWFEDARKEARDRWLNDLTAQSRATLFTAIEDGDAKRALEILERVDPTLAPPAHRHDFQGDGLKVVIETVYDDPDGDEED